MVPDVPFDLLGLNALYSVKYVDCDYNSYELPPAEKCPSPMACNESLQDGIDTSLFNDPGGIDECFPIIFDSGASLAISPLELILLAQLSPLLGCVLGEWQMG